MKAAAAFALLVAEALPYGISLGAGLQHVFNGRAVYAVLVCGPVKNQAVLEAELQSVAGIEHRRLFQPRDVSELGEILLGSLYLTNGAVRFLFLSFR